MEAVILSEFEIQEPADAPLNRAGTRITAHPYEISQVEYIQRLEIMAEESIVDEISSKRQKIAWMKHTRPEITRELSFAAQATAKNFNRRNLKDVKKVIRYIRNTDEILIKFPGLDQELPKIIAFADSSFGNSRDGGTQLGYIIILADGNQKCSIIVYRYYKARRNVR